MILFQNKADVFCDDGRKCTLEHEKMDIIFEIMDTENAALLCDNNGVILRVSTFFSAHYFVEQAEIIGKTVYQMENEKLFSPSAAVAVLNEKRRITLLQRTCQGKHILTTGVPIFYRNSNEIQYVISFNSIDIAGINNAYEQYSRIEELLGEYQNELNNLQLRKKSPTGLIAKSKSMETIREVILQLASVDVNVLITGETGVGKSMIAKLIHQSSSRCHGPFIEINCGAIPENLIESELFGYEKGAFTGASPKGHMGKIEAAHGGTLFLDEIGELPLPMQTKFLQTIQQKTIQRIGGISTLSVDFRLVTATNKQLEGRMAQGSFREDLFYRLNVIPLNIPALRDRVEDIVPLANYFLNLFNKKYNRNIAFDKEVFKIFESYTWPGNTREVENLIERLVVTSRKVTISTDDLPKELGHSHFTSKYIGETPIATLLEEYEEFLFLEAYDRNPNVLALSRALGISESSVARKIRKYVKKVYSPLV